jgi:biotin carboxyl carrier protein
VSQSKQNNQFEVTVNSFHFDIERNDILRNRSLEEYLSEKTGSSSIISNGFIKSPLNGKAIKVNFKNGDKVMKGDTLLVIESMKTENKIIAEHGGTVTELEVLEGEQVKSEQLLLRLN